MTVTALCFTATTEVRITAATLLPLYYNSDIQFFVLQFSCSILNSIFSSFLSLTYTHTHIPLKQMELGSSATKFSNTRLQWGQEFLSRFYPVCLFSEFPNMDGLMQVKLNEYLSIFAEKGPLNSKGRDKQYSKFSKL